MVVRLVFEDFWGHITGGSTALEEHFGVVDVLRESEVDHFDLQRVRVFKDEIFGLDVSVNDSLGVQVFLDVYLECKGAAA